MSNSHYLCTSGVQALTRCVRRRGHAPPGRLVAALAVAATSVLGLVSCSTTPSRLEGAVRDSPSASTPRGSVASSTPSGPTANAAPELPRGGRTLLPYWRVVTYYGAAGSPALGVLGSGTPDEMASRVEAAAAPYATAGHPVQPAFELIATVADRSPGPYGTYCSHVPGSVINTYLAAARRHHLLLILDVQPGHADPLTAVEHYQRWLTQPDVGLALDPEWITGAGQVPGTVIGHTDASTVNEISSYLAGLVSRDNLPQKLFVIHQFRSSMLPDRSEVVPRPGLAMVYHVDGFGAEITKRDVYASLHGAGSFFSGFKLFYTQDRPLLTPAQVLALTPTPNLISYQ